LNTYINMYNNVVFVFDFVRQTLTHTPRVNLETSVNLSCMFLGGGRKPEYLERTLAYKGKHANSLQKGPSWDSNQLL